MKTLKFLALAIPLTALAAACDPGGIAIPGAQEGCKAGATQLCPGDTPDPVKPGDPNGLNP